MLQLQHVLSLPASGRGLHDITPRVAGWLRGERVGQGVLTLFVRHTSASLLIQENADPDVQRDLEDFFARAVPEQEGLYRHADEGPDDMPAHVRSSLTQTHLSIPVACGQMLLGTWQAIYLFEHRRAPHRREVVLHYLGD